MNKRSNYLLSTILPLLALAQADYACTDFKATAKDGSIIITRSMEFGLDLKSNVRSSTQGRQFATTAPNGKPGASWKAKYGYLFIDGLDHDYSIDGMNEQGLSFEFLFFPGSTQYQAVPAGKESNAIPYIMLGDYILSNFKSVEEVRQALADKYVFQQNIPDLGDMVFPLHASVFDKTGKGLVIEFINGKMVISTNIGIMTNVPAYDWHVTNLRNYLNLSPYSPQPITVKGMSFSAIGQGDGAVGLPGDISPPSRFVKSAYLLNTAYAVNNATDLVNLAEHIINNVDIPLGLARSVSNGKETAELTQWVVFKDLTHNVMQYRTYNDMTLRKIDMSKINFAEGAERLKMPLLDQPYVMDVTTKFIGTRNN